MHIQVLENIVCKIKLGNIDFSLPGYQGISKQVGGTTRCITISMKYYALTGLERFDWYAHVWMSWEF